LGGWRAARNTELIQAKDKLSPSDMGTIQYDLKSEVALEITGYLTALPQPGVKIAGSLNRLKGWDDFLKADSVSAASYEITFQHTIENLFKDKFDANTYFLYVGGYRFLYPAVLALLKDPQNAWWGRGRNAALAKATEQTVDSLGSSLGSNPDN
jgi:acyl-homoserine lactone acylase PvdQ